MPTMLRVFNLMFVLHTRDHGHPHVTVYMGKPDNYEAMAKVRLDVIEIIEVEGFSVKAINNILQVVVKHQNDWLEAWNEYQK